jgi:Na+/proline symporter
MVILCIFIFAIYAGPDKNVGSIDRMYDMLKNAADTTDCRFGAACDATLTACGNVPGNKDGSYLTMLSKEGLIFGVINVVGNFGTVFLDQAYWQAAIAAKPESSAKGYLLGGLSWFCIPYALVSYSTLHACVWYPLLAYNCVDRNNLLTSHTTSNTHTYTGHLSWFGCCSTAVTNHIC